MITERRNSHVLFHRRYREYVFYAPEPEVDRVRSPPSTRSSFWAHRQLPSACRRPFWARRIAAGIRCCHEHLSLVCRPLQCRRLRRPHNYRLTANCQTNRTVPDDTRSINARAKKKNEIERVVRN